MTRGYTLYHGQGCGSTAVWAALELAGAKVKIEEAVAWEPEGAKKLAKVNPLLQVPTLVMPSGAIMTESTAMLMHVAEAFPDAGLAPTSVEKRAQLWRWMAFLSFNVYAYINIGDHPDRWLPGAETQAALKEATVEAGRRAWLLMEKQGAPVGGKAPNALDLYVAMMSRWRPGRAWFAEHCPTLMKAVAKTERHPVVARVWAENFPA